MAVPKTPLEAPCIDDVLTEFSIKVDKHFDEEGRQPFMVVAQLVRDLYAEVERQKKLSWCGAKNGEWCKSDSVKCRECQVNNLECERIEAEERASRYSIDSHNLRMVLMRVTVTAEPVTEIREWIDEKGKGDCGKYSTSLKERIDALLAAIAKTQKNLTKQNV